MRITAKGQVTLPHDIRERAGFLPHTEVDFVYDGRTVRIVHADGKGASRGARLVAYMRGRGSVTLTTDQIMALMRGR
jgi:bifunctional DNA-binding transcriptional regulator/antitoxin component of YhaV-PrlF toxin-antitoxin module